VPGFMIPDQVGTVDRTIVVSTLRGDQLPTIAGPSPKSRKDPFYTRIASTIAGGSRAVFCWNVSDWNTLAPNSKSIITLGYVEFRSPRRVNLNPLVCHWLDLIHYDHATPGPTVRMANAIVAFGHELIYTVLRARGVPYTRAEEAFAECVGMQLAPLVSYELGTSAAYGHAIARVMWNWYKPYHFPSGYWSSKCRPG
jgi:hypothetical protein